MLGPDYDFRKDLGNLIFLYIFIKFLCKIWPIVIPQKLPQDLSLVLSLKTFQVYPFALEKKFQQCGSNRLPRSSRQIDK